LHKKVFQRTALLPRASKHTSKPRIHILTDFYNYRKCEVMYMFCRMMYPDRLEIYGVFQTQKVTTSPLSANKQSFICQTDLHVSKYKPAYFLHITCHHVSKSIILLTDYCIMFSGMNLRMRNSHFCAENREFSTFISDKFVNKRNWCLRTSKRNMQ